jgi:hypothetical protein
MMKSQALAAQLEAECLKAEHIERERILLEQSLLAQQNQQLTDVLGIMNAMTGLVNQVKSVTQPQVVEPRDFPFAILESRKQEEAKNKRLLQNLARARKRK